MHELTNKKYSIAVDLGTTTIEIAIIDVNRNIIASDYFTNPQKLYGRDVITRIYSATRDKKLIKVMKNMFIEEFKTHLMNILSSKFINNDNINAIAICGNTTMISILLEYDIKELGEYPFNHQLDNSVIKEAQDIFYKDFPFNCQVLLSGCSSAFIGGDVISGLISIEKDYKLISVNKPYFFLDLGTNGEMVLFDGSNYYTSSAACGPAFEASIRSSNIYGSNLIDAIALAIKAKRISQDGIIMGDKIKNNLDILGVSINADILRDILLAKAAIRTGIDILIDKACIDSSNLTVYIAGGFGFHLDIENAVYIGLIPNYFKDKIKIVGNTSLKGAITLLNSNLNLIDEFKNNNTFNLIQMANLPDYQERLINNINFKQ